MTEACILGGEALFCCLYLYPTLIATLRHHKNEAAIAIVNVLFGWTLLGWGVALAWAMKPPHLATHHSSNGGT